MKQDSGNGASNEENPDKCDQLLRLSDRRRANPEENKDGVEVNHASGK